MVDNPIDKSSVKSNVAAHLFALDPFVTEYFRFLGAKCQVKPRFHEALRHIVRINECHGVYSAINIGTYPANVKYSLKGLVPSMGCTPHIAGIVFRPCSTQRVKLCTYEIVISSMRRLGCRLAFDTIYHGD
jgi:hypothetical protein